MSKKLFLHKTKPGVLVDEAGKIVPHSEICSLREAATQVECNTESAHQTAKPSASQTHFERKVAEVESYRSLGLSLREACIAASAEFLLTESLRAGVPLTEAERLTKNLITPVKPIDWTKI